MLAYYRYLRTFLVVLKGTEIANLKIGVRSLKIHFLNQRDTDFWLLKIPLQVLRKVALLQYYWLVTLYKKLILNFTKIDLWVWPTECLKFTGTLC